MARGIERRKIFWDDKDRSSFLERFAVILEETQTQCYAWALIPNHFHILLRTGPTPLSTVMRRLMTGYAVAFNRRHRRAGHLFQNRYKSVVCEEDPYLLELIRYIHLNPLRARLVADIKELDKYPWTWHSAILGRRRNHLLIPDPPKKCSATCANPSASCQPLAERTIQDVLLHFGDTKWVARQRYRQFVKNGMEQGKRPELQGGGLVRSAGGNKLGLLGRKSEEREKADERVLGSGDFVSKIIEEADKEVEKGVLRRPALEALTREVVTRMGISPLALVSDSRNSSVSRARAVISYLAIMKAGYTQQEVGHHLNVSRIAVRSSLARGGKQVDICKEIWEKLV
jgi:REP element-mobilizing transposase RayT